MTGSPLVGNGLRHVRDIWQAALSDTPPFRLSELAVGSLAVTARTYTIGGGRVIMPGHVGIITDRESLTLLHANPAAGVVEERPIRDIQTILGGIALEL